MWIINLAITVSLYTQVWYTCKKSLLGVQGLLWCTKQTLEADNAIMDGFDMSGQGLLTRKWFRTLITHGCRWLHLWLRSMFCHFYLNLDSEVYQLFSVTCFQAVYNVVQYTMLSCNRHKITNKMRFLGW